MLKNKSSKLKALLIIVLFLSVAIMARPANALVSQNSQNWFWNSDTNAASIAAGDVNGDGQTEIATVGYWNDGLHWNSLLQVWNATTLSVENVVSWKWTNDTNAVCVAVGDVNGDGQNEIVTGGTYFDGSRWIAQLQVWNGTTLVPENVITWYWGSDTQISSIAIGDVNGDSKNEIVTGGTYFDGTRYVAQLHVWNGATLAVEKVQTWYWGGDTYVNSVVISNITGGTSLSIITGGSFNDSIRTNAQLFVWSTSTPSLTVQNGVTWFTTSNTNIASIAVGNFTGGTSLDIATGGSFNDGIRNNAQVVDFNGANLAVKSSSSWFTTSNTEVNSVAIGPLSGASNRIVASGEYFDGTRSEAQLTIWT